ncbi:NAD-binding protein [Kamptonema cortianum]|nr:NAD-binding protein [Kamptonema cortianum]
MLLADAKYSQQIRADVFPLRTLFVTLFFVSIGLLADLSWLLSHLPLVLLGTVVVLSVKTVATYFALRPFVPGIIEVLATSVAISQIGEFSFVIMTIGKDSGIIPEDLFQLVIGTTLFTLILTPFTVGNALRISRFLAKRVFPARKLAASERLSRAVSLNEHLVIIGYGEAGQGAAHAVNSYSFEKLIIDLDPKLVRLAERHGFKAMIGDATNHEILEHAQIFNAMAIIIAVPDHNASRIITGVCKSVAPGVPLIVRARYHAHKDELDMVGADTVVDEEELVGRALGEEACRLGGMQATKSKNFSWDSDENYA